MATLEGDPTRALMYMPIMGGTKLGIFDGRTGGLTDWGSNSETYDNCNVIGGRLFCVDSHQVVRVFRVPQ